VIDDDRPPNLISLRFQADNYRRAAALVTAYAHNDLDSCGALLADDPRGLACALLIFTYSALARFAERGDGSFIEELQDLAVAAAKCAAEEGS
jgi:hypothetical protein